MKAQPLNADLTGTGKSANGRQRVGEVRRKCICGGNCILRYRHPDVEKRGCIGHSIFERALSLPALNAPDQLQLPPPNLSLSQKTQRRSQQRWLLLQRPERCPRAPQRKPILRRKPEQKSRYQKLIAHQERRKSWRMRSWVTVVRTSLIVSAVLGWG